VQKDFVLCKLKKNSDDKLTCEEGGSSSNMASDFPNNVTEVRSSMNHTQFIVPRCSIKHIKYLHFF
jgi:hypothetical protein